MFKPDGQHTPGWIKSKYEYARAPSHRTPYTRGTRAGVGVSVLLRAGRSFHN